MVIASQAKPINRMQAGCSNLASGGSPGTQFVPGLNILLVRPFGVNYGGPCDTYKNCNNISPSPLRKLNKCSTLALLTAGIDDNTYPLVELVMVWSCIWAMLSYRHVMAHYSDGSSCDIPFVFLSIDDISSPKDTASS